MPEHSTLILIGTFCVVSLTTYVVLYLLDPYRMETRQRLAELQTGGTSGAPGQPLVVRGSTPLQLLGERLATATSNRASIRDRLTNAGFYDPAAVSRFFLIKLLATVIPVVGGCGAALIGGLRWEPCLVAGMIVGSAGAMLPGVWLDRRTRARHRMFRRSLPDFLDLMIVCLDGGLSLQGTLRRVTEELQIAHPELAVELEIVQREVELGTSIDVALRRFATRSGYEGVRTLSTFVREAQRFGTNLSEALRSHGECLRAQREQAAEEMAQKASVKILIPTLLLILPAVFVVLVGPAVIQIQQAFSGN